MRLLLIFFFFLISCVRNDLPKKTFNQLQDLHKKAILYFQEGNIGEALKLVNESLIIDPKNTTSLLLKGDIYFESNLSRSSKDLWIECVQIEPENIDCRIRLAYLYRAIGDYDLSGKYLDEVLTIDRNNGNAYYYKALNSSDLGDVNQAVKWLQYALETGYENPKTYLALASLLESTDTMLASEYYSLVLKKYPNDDRVLHNVGLFHQDNNEINKAIELYNRAIVLNENSYNTYYNLGHLHQELKLYNKATSYFLKALEINPLYHESAYGAGYCFESVGDISNALYYYKKALEIKEDYKPASDRINSINN